MLKLHKSENWETISSELPMAAVNCVHFTVCFLFANSIFCDIQQQRIADYFPISHLLSSDKTKAVPVKADFIKLGVFCYWLGMRSSL